MAKPQENNPHLGGSYLEKQPYGSFAFKEEAYGNNLFIDSY